MYVREAIALRRTVRDYKPENVPEEVIRELLDDAVMAPSSMNLQPWGFVVVQDREMIDRINEAAKHSFLDSNPLSKIGYEFRKPYEDPHHDIFFGANTLVLICSKPTAGHPEWDCCLAAENLMLSARERGLGTAVIGLALEAFKNADIRKELDIPDDSMVVMPIVLGYPREFPDETPRRFPEIFSWKPGAVTPKRTKVKV